MRSRPRPPRVTGTPPGQLALGPGQARAQRMVADHLACRSAAVAYPRVLPFFPPAGTASRVSIRRTRACRLARSARRFCSASRTWSSLVRVIAPAQRDDDSAVSARFRHALDTARPSASSRPLRAPCGQVTARQRPQVGADGPQHRLILRRHPQPRRTRAPAGAAATTGAAISRSPLTRGP